jgi:hypothetical protein
LLASDAAVSAPKAGIQQQPFNEDFATHTATAVCAPNWRAETRTGATARTAECGEEEVFW